MHFPKNFAESVLVSGHYSPPKDHVCCEWPFENLPYDQLQTAINRAAALRGSPTPYSMSSIDG
jgi:hypothetical protein